MNRDLENAMKAEQCASLLIDDIRSLAESSSPFVSDIALEQLMEINAIHYKLKRIICNINHNQPKEPA